MTMISTTALESLAYILPSDTPALQMARIASWAGKQIEEALDQVISVTLEGMSETMPALAEGPVLTCVAGAVDAQDAPISCAAMPAAAPQPAQKDAAPAVAFFAPNWTEAEDLQLLQSVLIDKKSLAMFVARTERSEAAAKYRLRILEGKIAKRDVPAHALKWFADQRGQAKAKLASAKSPTAKPSMPAATTAPVVKPSPPAAVQPKTIGTLSELPAMTATQGAIQRQLLAVLNDDFTPEDDLYLVEELLKGTPAEMIADQLAVTAKDVTARWKKMMVADVAVFAGAPDQRAKDNLLIVLRRLAGQA